MQDLFENYLKNGLSEYDSKYLSTYQYDGTDKERICNLLGYDYKNLYIKDQKEKMLGEI